MRLVKIIRGHSIEGGKLPFYSQINTVATTFVLCPYSAQDKRSDKNNFGIVSHIPP